MNLNQKFNDSTTAIHPNFYPFRSSSAQIEFFNLYEKQAKDWPIDSECTTIETSFGQTFLRISGPAEAPSLVLLPGAGASSLMWSDNIEALSRSYRTYALDSIYDFGRSRLVKPMKSVGACMNWLDEVFNGLELGDNINLMGLSYGGWLTCQYALHYPTRLHKIVLLAPAATVLRINLQFIFRALLTLIPVQYFTKSFVFWVFQDVLQAHGLQKVEQKLESRLIKRRCARLGPPILPSVLTDHELSNLSIPTLFLVGENEVLYCPKKALKRLRSVAPQIQAEVIPQSGHSLHRVQTDIVNNKILTFLNASGHSD